MKVVAVAVAVVVVCTS